MEHYVHRPNRRRATQLWNVGKTNHLAEIVGYTTNAAEAFHATTWATNTSAPQDLGTLPGGTNSYARGIENRTYKEIQACNNKETGISHEEYP